MLKKIIIWCAVFISIIIGNTLIFQGSPEILLSVIASNLILFIALMSFNIMEGIAIVVEKLDDKE